MRLKVYEVDDAIGLSKRVDLLHIERISAPHNGSGKAPLHHRPACAGRV